MRPYVVESSAYDFHSVTGHAAVYVVNSGSACTDTGHFAVSQCQLNELPVKALRLAQTIERLSQGSRGLGFADAYLVDRYWVSSSYITT
jgi:hypothetical protein